MYCPKCSQELVSDELRFCSRCGFSLTAVRELIESGALMEPGAVAQAEQLFKKQKGIRRGTWMMLASLALAVFVGMLSAVDDDFAVFLFVPFLVFIIGFIRVLYGVFFKGKRAARLKPPQQIMPGQISTPQGRPELSAPRVAPIESFTGQRVKTAEMVHAPSVTENTTRLLDEESDPHRR